MRRLSLTIAMVLSALGIMYADVVWAAVASITITVAGPASTSVTCAPVAAGGAANSVVCPIAVLPSGWAGSLTLSGPDVAKFAISGSNLVVGATALAAGTYNVTITSAP
jgi:hypothetical protein